MLFPVGCWSNRLARLRIEDGRAGQVEVDGDALARPAHVMGLELRENRLAGQAEAGIAARACRLHQLDDRLEPGAAGGRRRARRAADMLWPEAQDDRRSLARPVEAAPG